MYLIIDSCRVISSVPAGRLVNIRDINVQGISSDTVEYIWVIKLPDYIRPQDTDAVVFARIMDSTVDCKTSLYIYKTF